MAVACGNEGIERAMARHGLLRTPEDLGPPRVVALADALEDVEPAPVATTLGIRAGGARERWAAG